MIRKKIFGLALGIAAIWALECRADVIVSVDLDPVTAGIQNNLPYTVGQTVTANIVMSLTGSTALSFYQFSVGFDRNELTFVSRTESLPPGFGFVETDTRNLDNLGSNPAQAQLYLFGADTGAGPVAPFGPFVVATATFQVNSPIGGSGDIDIFPYKNATAPFEDDFLSNGTFAPIPDGQLFFNGAAITPNAVPEPTSLSMLGLGLLTVSVCRRKRKID
ncbi:MAG: PEP-CTERM sorting domain-containing protein [Pirellulaceae bacterium]|nr:PEP-CTERM sorting domain-containing protein [Pirellulaceae bacterium]